MDNLGYFDLIYDAGGGWEVKNQLFYEGYKNLNENAYGFAQIHQTYAIEDKIVVSKKFELPGVSIDTQLSPSMRYTKFKHGDDYDYELFHRVDLTQGYNALSDRLLTTEGDTQWSEYYSGLYDDYGIAGPCGHELRLGLGCPAWRPI